MDINYVIVRETEQSSVKVCPLLHHTDEYIIHMYVYMTKLSNDSTDHDYLFEMYAFSALYAIHFSFSYN